MRRYTTAGDWQTIATETLNYYTDTVSVKTEEATAVDTKTGSRHRGGAIRVTLSVRSTRKTKTFIGETANHDARRWVSDTANKVTR